MNLARTRMTRYGLAAACFLLSAAALADYLDGRRQRTELEALLSGADFGRRSDAVLERIETERTAHHARTLASRFLVYDVLDAGAVRGDSIAVGSQEGPKALAVGSAGWDAAVDRLPVAADLARQVLAVQPNSWQASMLLGAAVYLERSIHRDERLYTSYRDWEEPLAHAIREAPGQAEPRRFLAAAYLEVWPALSAEKKETARRILAEAFANDLRAFSKLLPVWLQAAQDLDEAFAVIPERSSAWRELERIYAERREWEAFCQAHVRQLAVVFEEHEVRLAEAERRLTLGEFFHSRSLLLQVVAASPLDVRFAPHVKRALELYPPGLHGLSSTERVKGWLRWVLELHVFGRDVLPPNVVSRLASAAGSLDPPEQALAALVAGEVYHAESFERSAESLSSSKWGTYLLAKARWYVERGQVDEATATLKLADHETRDSLAYALARHKAARAGDDLVELAEAERVLDAFRRAEWSAAGWTWSAGETRALLPMLVEAPAEGLVVMLNQVSKLGAVIEIHWNGKTVALHPVTADGELELAFAVDAGLHLLEVRMLAGQKLSPGRVALVNSGR